MAAAHGDPGDSAGRHGGIRRRPGDAPRNSPPGGRPAGASRPASPSRAGSIRTSRSRRRRPTRAGPSRTGCSSLEPFAQLEFVSPRTEFSSGYQGYVRRYIDVEQLNGFDQRGYLSLRRLATKRVTYFLRDSYADVPTTDEVELNGVPFARTGVRTNALAAGIDARLTKFTDLAVRFDNDWVDFDRTDTFLTGGWVNGVRTELSRRLTGRVVGRRRVRRSLRGPERRHAPAHVPGCGGHAALRARRAHQPSRSAAASRTSTIVRSTITRTGPYVRAELTHDATRATVGAAFERMFVPSFGFGGSSQSQQVRGFDPHAAQSEPHVHPGLGLVAAQRAVRAERARARHLPRSDRPSATRRRDGSASKASTRSRARTRR